MDYINFEEVLHCGPPSEPWPRQRHTRSVGRAARTPLQEDVSRSSKRRKAKVDELHYLGHTVIGKGNKVRFQVTSNPDLPSYVWYVPKCKNTTEEVLALGWTVIPRCHTLEESCTGVTIMKNIWQKIWKWICKPFVWMWTNLKDPVTAIIFGIVFVVLSSEVWVPYLIGFIVPSTRTYMWSIGSACWLFWLGPGTPFLPLCMAITVGIKALWNKLRRHKHE